MICRISGQDAIGFKNDGSWIKTVYTAGGKSNKNVFGSDKIPLAFYDEFLEFNTEFWNTRSGEYRNWHYMPVDYSRNIIADGGNLIIRNLKDNPAEGYDWSGMWADTSDKVEVQYGRITARIKFPADADRYHATLWMLGNNPGEFDIAESNSGSVTAAVHTYTRNGDIRSFGIGRYRINDPTKWHIYAMDWNEDTIRFYVDGHLHGSIKVSDADYDGYNCLKQPFYLVLNTNPYDTSKKEFSTSDSVTTMIDWIYVFSNQIN